MLVHVWRWRLSSSVLLLDYVIAHILAPFIIKGCMTAPFAFDARAIDHWDLAAPRYCHVSIKKGVATFLRVASFANYSNTHLVVHINSSYQVVLHVLQYVSDVAAISISKYEAVFAS